MIADNNRNNDLYGGLSAASSIPYQMIGNSGKVGFPAGVAGGVYWVTGEGRNNPQVIRQTMTGQSWGVNLVFGAGITIHQSVANNRWVIGLAVGLDLGIDIYGKSKLLVQ